MPDKVFVLFNQKPEGIGTSISYLCYQISIIHLLYLSLKAGKRLQPEKINLKIIIKAATFWAFVSTHSLKIAYNSNKKNQHKNHLL